MANENVFLVPCDPGNFDRTVGSPVGLEEYPDRPAPLDEYTSARFWGVRDGEGNRSYFEKMEPDDLVVFYQNGTYIGVGYIETTFEDEEGWVRSTFWQNAPSTLIYIIREYATISVPKNQVNTIFGYSEGYYPQGLMRVADDRLTNRVGAIKRALETVSEEGL